MVSPLHGDGSARRNAATSSGVTLQAARRAKETTYPELSGEGERGPSGCLGSRSGRWLVPGNRRFPQCHGQSEGGRIPTDLAGQGQNGVHQTLECHVGVLPDKFVGSDFVGAAASP